MDSKSVVSYSFNPLYSILPNSAKDMANRTRVPGETIPRSTTYQTYLFILNMKPNYGGK
jgi:hypothetical protein